MKRLALFRNISIMTDRKQTTYVIWQGYFNKAELI